MSASFALGLLDVKVVADVNGKMNSLLDVTLDRAFPSPPETLFPTDGTSGTSAKRQPKVSRTSCLRQGT